MNTSDLKLLEELVNIDSGTGDQAGIAKIFTILRRELEPLGFRLEERRAGDGSLHYYATRGQGERILLVAHMDTVFPQGTAAAKPFTTQGERAYGPGVSDCKSGVVTILGALKQLGPEWPAQCEIGCFFNSDEEISSPGSREILAQLAPGTRFALVVEPAEGENITIARKGIGRFELKVFGKAAHSGSNFQDGANAVLELAYKIIALQKVIDLEAGITLNAGVISGGIRPNIIPDYAVAEIDLRICRPEQEGPLLQELRRITSQCTVPGTTSRIDGKITRPPMPVTPANQRLYEALRRVSKTQGVDLGAIQSGGGSDANLLAGLGVATVDGVGPIGGGHHSDTEYLELPSLKRRIDLLAAFLRESPAVRLGEQVGIVKQKCTRRYR